MITAAWQPGARQATGDTRFRQWAHMLGYGGHFLTKSRLYSVTFGQLRTARAEHHRAQRHPDGERDPWGRPLDETVVLILKTWSYAGTGYTPHSPGSELALVSADIGTRTLATPAICRQPALDTKTSQRKEANTHYEA